MNTVTVVVLLHHFLFAAFVQSAPISSLSLLPPAFKAAAERAKTLVEKILKDIPTIHAATVHIEGLTLDPVAQTANLQTMVTSLGIPPAPILKPLSERFTLDESVRRMSAGGRLYQGLLEVLSSRLSGLTDLRTDLRDLLTQITMMKEAAQFTVTSESDQSGSEEMAGLLHGDYDVQVATHLTLAQLRSFCHDLSRSLRAAAAYRLRPAAAR